MTPHDRALELMRLSQRDERAARVLQEDPTIDHATIGFHYQQAAEKLVAVAFPSPLRRSSSSASPRAALPATGISP